MSEEWIKGIFSDEADCEYKGILHIRRDLKDWMHSGQEILFGDYAKEWLEIYMKPHVASTTYLQNGASDEFIFGGKEPLRYQAMRDIWKRIRTQIDLCGATGYTFRHTVLTDLYDATKDVKTTQRYAGHINPDMTMRRYVHDREECSQELAKRLDHMYTSTESCATPMGISNF